MEDAALSKQFGSTLGPDLLALIRRRPARWIGCTAIASQPTQRRGRAVFRLEFEDGSRLKARRFGRVERAQMVAAIHGVLGAGFARLVDHEGDGLFTEWVEGPGLEAVGPASPGLLGRCGELLGGLHGLDAPIEATGWEATPSSAFARLGRSVDELRAADLLDPGLAREALAAADDNRPSEASVGIVHKDLCPENLVIGASGMPISVDDGGLAIGSRDLDLARTWYRWPMGASERAHFTAGYQKHRSLDSFDRHFVFWMICVVASSSAWQLRSGVPGVPELLHRLLGFVESPASRVE